jgi:hypothetical protein
VEGVVTVPSGTFDAGFALQEDSGGIYVTRVGDKPARLGDRVQVSGRLTASNGRIAVEPGLIAIMGSGAVPLPREARTGTVGPSTEGRLIAVRGRIVRDLENDQPWGWKLYLDDGSGPLLVFIASQTRIDVSGFRAGHQLRIVGFSGRYDQHTELLPRTQADITSLPNEERLSR